MKRVLLHQQRVRHIAAPAMGETQRNVSSYYGCALCTALPSRLVPAPRRGSAGALTLTLWYLHPEEVVLVIDPSFLRLESVLLRQILV